MSYKWHYISAKRQAEQVSYQALETERKLAVQKWIVTFTKKECTINKRKQWIEEDIWRAKAGIERELISYK